MSTSMGKETRYIGVLADEAKELIVVDKEAELDAVYALVVEKDGVPITLTIFVSADDLVSAIERMVKDKNPEVSILSVKQHNPMK